MSNEKNKKISNEKKKKMSLISITLKITRFEMEEFDFKN